MPIALVTLAVILFSSANIPQKQWDVKDDYVLRDK